MHAPIKPLAFSPDGDMHVYMVVGSKKLENILEELWMDEHTMYVS